MIARESAGVALMLIAVASCASSDIARARNVTINVWYADALDECIARGKLAGSVEVYEACARAIDRETCVRYSARCEQALDGGSDAR